MSRTVKVGLVQLNSGTDPSLNLGPTEELLREAGSRGCDLILTPEMTDFYEPALTEIPSKAAPEDEHPFIRSATAVASEFATWILIGSVNVRLPNGEVANRSVLVSPEGAIAARYDKIHLFDVDIPDGQVYRESSVYRSGTNYTLVDTTWGRLGMSICYDVRFPGLYRHVAKEGAEVISVPAAFTHLTGVAHWATLIRSRAIETGSFVLAAAQCGFHGDSRRTYGHSMVVDPWGEVLVEGGEDVDVFVTTIDLERVAAVRTMIPSLRGD